MQQSLFTQSKINNEIELCEVFHPDCKKMIERQLLKQRISYYIKWPRTSFFRRQKDNCILCVHSDVREKAEAIVRAVCDESGFSVRFICKKLQNDYL